MCLFIYLFIFVFIYLFIYFMSSSLVIFLFHDNIRPCVARMTLQKLIDLVFETLPQPPYSPDLSRTDYRFFKRWGTFTCQKQFRSKREVETAFKDFLASKPLEVFFLFVFQLELTYSSYVKTQDVTLKTCQRR